VVYHFTDATKGVEMMSARIEKHNIECDFQVQDSLFLGSGKKVTEKIIP